MLLEQVTEEIIRADNGGIITDENRADQDYMEALVGQGRAMAILQQFTKTHRLSPNWTLRHICEYDQDFQETVDFVKFVKFAVPPVVTLDGKSDGFSYVGTQNGMKQYRKVTTRATYVNNNLHRFTKQGEGEKYFYTDGAIEVYGNEFLTEGPLCDAVWANPADANQYNKLYDNYPISLDLLPIMKDVIFKTDLIRVYARKLDTKSDSADSTATPNMR